MSIVDSTLTLMQSVAFRACHDALFRCDILENIGSLLFSEEGAMAIPSARCLSSLTRGIDARFDEMLWAGLPPVIPLPRLLSAFYKLRKVVDDYWTKLYVSLHFTDCINNCAISADLPGSL